MLKRIGAESASELKAVASGTLPSGRPVIVNADGTVSMPASTSTSAGTEVVFESASIGDTDITYDSSNNKVVVCYKDNGNSNSGTAVVGTVNNSNNSITFGTPVVFNSGRTDNPKATFDSTNNKVVIIYSDHPSSLRGTAIVGTVSGTAISFGSEVQYETGRTDWNAVTFDSGNGKVIAVYQDIDDNDKGKAAVGTVSGTSISFGTPVIFEADNAQYMTATFDSTNGKVVIAYRNQTDTAGNAIVGTVSGTSISFGSAAVYSTDNVRDQKAAFDPVNNKVVIVFRDEGNSDVGTGIVGTVSGTSISFGSKVVYFSTRADQNYISYNTVAGKFMITFIDDSGTPLKAIGATVSGTSLTVDSAATTIAAAASFKSVNVYDANAERIVVAWQDTANSSYGTGAVVTTGFDTLTSENYIGMSRGTAFQTGSADSVGSETQFINQMGNELSAGVYDPDSSKVILAYSDQDAGVDGTAIVGTVSGTSISFGTPAVYDTAETTHIGITYDTTNNKVVIVYRDGAGNNNYGNAIVGTVSGTSISFGTAAVYNAATSQYNAAAFDTNTGKVVIAYKDGGDNSVQSRVGTVSGTDISFGTEVQVVSSGTYVQAVFDSNSNKVVVLCRDSSNSNYGTARVGTVSGTNISYGTAVVFASSITEDIHAGFDSTNNKIVISYKDGGDSDKGKVVVGTVSGTSISFGSAVTFHDASTGPSGVVHNSNSGKVFLFYKNSSGIGKVVSGTVSGTTVGSLSSEFTYHNASTNVPFHVYDVASTNIVIAYRDGGDSNKGKAVVFKPDNIGTTRAEVASGQAASIDIIGSVSDNQVSLTPGQQYFVQTDGTISETAGSPSVLAGTAISATELVVKT